MLAEHLGFAGTVASEGARTDQQLGVAAVGLSALAGVVVHGLLLVIFFLWGATYWLPVAPGWLALSLLQRRDYV